MHSRNKTKVEQHDFVRIEEFDVVFNEHSEDIYLIAGFLHGLSKWNHSSVLHEWSTLNV